MNQRNDKPPSILDLYEAARIANEIQSREMTPFEAWYYGDQGFTMRCEWLQGKKEDYEAAFHAGRESMRNEIMDLRNREGQGCCDSGQRGASDPPTVSDRCPCHRQDEANPTSDPS